MVYCSITGFGQTGPYAPRAGYDYLVQAAGGLMSTLGGQQLQAQNQLYQQALGGFGANLQAGQQELAAAQQGAALGQQGFQNYLAQQGLNLQGTGLAEQAAVARNQAQRENQAQGFGQFLQSWQAGNQNALNWRNMSMNEQELGARIAGLL
jgi:hypothetical protein